MKEQLSFSFEKKDKSLKELFTLLPLDQQKKRLAQLSDQELAALQYDWSWNARPKQLPPEDDQSIWATTIYFESKGKKYGFRIPKDVREKWQTWILLAGRGFGKSLDVETPIPTPTGWKRLGEVVDGDLIFDEKGQVTTVVKAHTPYFTHDVYEITFSDKTTIIADKEHQWVVWEHLDRKQYGRYDSTVKGSFPVDWATYRGDKYDAYGSVVGHFGAKVLTTQNLLSRLDKSPCIPQTRPLETLPKKLPIDPWVLGYWLGNGDSKSGGVHTGSHQGETDFEHVLERFLERGYTVDKSTPDHSRDETRTYCGHIYSSTLHKQLKDERLLGNKHVPSIYLRGSIQQRLELLQGLMDSDGNAGNENCRNFVGFSSTIKQLADAVYELAVSLGEHPRRQDGPGMLYGVTKKHCWGISYRPNVIPFTLPRKKTRVTLPEDQGQTLRHKHRIIKKITKAEGRMVRCLTVDSPSSVYLAGEQMIPTHNTRVGAETVRRYIKDKKINRVCIIAPTSADTRDVVTEGESGLVNICPPWDTPVYEPSKRRISWKAGESATLYSAEEADRLRGPQQDFGWLDEMAAWANNNPERVRSVWDMYRFGLRLGTNPRTVITTTPKPFPLIVEMVDEFKEEQKKIQEQVVNIIQFKDKNYEIKADKNGVPVVTLDPWPSDLKFPTIYLTTGSSYENKSNLAEPFFDQIVKYEGTALGRQEIHAEIIDVEETGIVKRSWFKLWTKKDLPPIIFVLQSYDTAFTEKTENDPTACSTYGVFNIHYDNPEKDPEYGILLLDAWQDHMSYPELRKRAMIEYNMVYGGAHPDTVLIEAKGTGLSLIQDMATAGVPARPYNPGAMDKTARLHAVSHIIFQGHVYVPEHAEVKGEVRNWAVDFIRQVCSYPNVEHDDYVDTFSQALAYLRDQQWMTLGRRKLLPIEEEMEEQEPEEYTNPYCN